MSLAPPDFNLDLKAILSHYDFGGLVDYRCNPRGTVNANYEIETELGGERRKLFLRCYKESIQPAEIEFEHSLIKHLISQGLSTLANVHPTRSGRTYLEYKQAGKERKAYFALFDYLAGEDKYSWVNPRCTQQEIKSAAQVLAQFHAAVQGFVPRGYRNEPKIIDLLPEILQAIRSAPEKSKNSVFDEFLNNHSVFLTEQVERTFQWLMKHMPSDLPEIVIHCDYHPGNLKFHDGEVVGLLDFDWSKIDLRVFDVALAAWYFFTDWSDDKDGCLRLEELSVFLAAYQDYLQTHRALPPLTKIELELLSEFINAGNFYVLNWTLQDFYNKDVNADEYLVYLKHCVNFIRWSVGKGLNELMEKYLKVYGIIEHN